MNRMEYQVISTVTEDVLLQYTRQGYAEKFIARAQEAGLNWGPGMEAENLAVREIVFAGPMREPSAECIARSNKLIAELDALN